MNPWYLSSRIHKSVAFRVCLASQVLLVRSSDTLCAMEGASRRLALLEGHLVSYETYSDAAIERNPCAAAAAAPGAAPVGAGPVVLIGGMVMDLQVRVEGTDDAALGGEYAGHVIKPQVDVQPPNDVPEPSAMCDTSCRLALAVPPMCSAAAQSPAGCRSLQVGRAAASGELLKSKVASSCTCQTSGSPALPSSQSTALRAPSAACFHACCCAPAQAGWLATSRKPWRCCCGRAGRRRHACRCWCRRLAMTLLGALCCSTGSRSGEARSACGSVGWMCMQGRQAGRQAQHVMYA